MTSMPVPSIRAYVDTAVAPEIKNGRGKVISKGNKKDRLNFKLLSEKYHVAINAIRRTVRTDLPKMTFKDKFLEFFGIKCAFIQINYPDSDLRIWVKINVNSLIKRFGIEKREINAVLKHSLNRNITVYLNAKIQGMVPPAKPEEGGMGMGMGVGTGIRMGTVEQPKEEVPVQKVLTLDDILKVWDANGAEYARNKDVNLIAAKAAEGANYELLEKILLSGEVSSDMALEFLRARIRKNSQWFFYGNFKTALGKDFFEKNHTLWNAFMGVYDQDPQEPLAQAEPVNPPAPNDVKIVYDALLKEWKENAQLFRKTSSDNAKEILQGILEDVVIGDPKPLPDDLALKFLQEAQVSKDYIWFFKPDRKTRNDFGEVFYETNQKLWNAFMGGQEPAVQPELQVAPVKDIFAYNGVTLNLKIPNRTEYSYQGMLDNSVKFYNALKNYYHVPKSNRIAELHNLALDKKAFEDEVSNQAVNTRIILDKKLVQDICAFLADKKKNGNDNEKGVYENMTPIQMIQRLITKRPLVFLNETDEFLLRPEHDCARGSGFDEEFVMTVQLFDFLKPQNGSKKISLFEAIGTPFEGLLKGYNTEEINKIIHHVTLKNYLSYQEMELSARLQVAAPSFLINAGGMENRAKKGEPGTFEEKALIIGAVGCRFEIDGLMEAKSPYWKEKLDPIDKADDYELIENSKFGKGYFNKILYKERMKEIYRSILITANEQGKKGQKTVVQMHSGLGLSGEWVLSKSLQTDITLEAIEEILVENNFDRIAAINLGWIEGHQENKGENIGGVHLFYHMIYPGEKLGKISGMDLTGLQPVIVYHWNGNAYVGNEYWLGDLDNSMAPASACFSTIGELQNPEINPWFLNNISIVGVKEDEVEKYKNLLLSN